jgi:pimeloyl-ACP methyl ester carboxylesterase
MGKSRAGQDSREEQSVTSRDGTRIAFERVGSGPAVILVSGATADRRWNGPLAQALASEFTVLNYDRRGRGGSGDTLPYALERELEDIDALITHAGGSANLYGISSGGALALEAAAAGLAIDRLAVYEVPYGVDDDQPRRQAEYVADLERAAREGPGARMEVFLRLMGADDAAVAATRNSDEWPGLVAVEHTLAYDAACMGTGQPPVDRLARITVPTLVLTGAPEGEHEVGSSEFFDAAAGAIVASIPSAEHRRLPNQTHMVDPQVLAPALMAFYRG